MKINPKIAWSSYIWWIVLDKILDKNASVKSFCEDNDLVRPTIDNVLKGRTVGTKKLFDKIFDILNISQSKRDDIYIDAKIQEIKIEFWDDVFKQMLKKELTKEQLIDIISG